MKKPGISLPTLSRSLLSYTFILIFQESIIAFNISQPVTDPFGYQVSRVPQVYNQGQGVIQQLQYPQISVYSSGGGYQYPNVPSDSFGNVQYYSETEKDALLENALKAAWDEYGPKSRITSVGSSSYSHRDTSDDAMYMGQMSGFQPSESEWDQHVTAIPVAVQPPAVQPNFVNRLLASYINFEVNHHELADFFRRAVFFGFVGLIMVGWVALGFWLGLLPLKLLGVASRKRDVDESMDSNGNSIVSEITDRVMLALDQDWLHKLQEKIQSSENARSWTHVQCCLLPDAKARGMTDCHPIRAGTKNSPWKCLTNLIYNIQFGPDEPVQRIDKRKSPLKKSSKS